MPSGETDVRRDVRGGIRVHEGSDHRLRRSFLRDPPGPCAVDRLAVAGKPVSERFEDESLSIRNRPIRLGTDVQQEQAVLRHRVREFGDEGVDRLIFVSVDPAPGVLRDGRIVLPDMRADSPHRPALDVVDRAALRERIPLVVYGDAATPFGGAVVVVRSQQAQVWLERGLLDPPVEPEHLRPVVVDDLHRAKQPVFEESLVRRQLFALGGPIEVVVGRIAHVRVEP